MGWIRKSIIRLVGFGIKLTRGTLSEAVEESCWATARDVPPLASLLLVVLAALDFRRAGEGLGCETLLFLGAGLAGTFCFPDALLLPGGRPGFLLVVHGAEASFSVFASVKAWPNFIVAGTLSSLSSSLCEWPLGGGPRRWVAGSFGRVSELVSLGFISVPCA